MDYDLGTHCMKENEANLTWRCHHLHNYVGNSCIDSKNYLICFLQFLVFVDFDILAITNYTDFVLTKILLVLAHSYFVV